MQEAMAAWERARFRLAEALGEETLRVAGNGMSRLAVAAQAAVSIAGFEEPCNAAE
jgi:hypothetical protein